ncbi:G-type lectin S-receptor-like serine/threonine-protein kinase LECRK3 [Vigna angularis]|uniref:G-type lectin S-receptor-like serine/threonine-protein kinase LECRK3 n=1 Tax=Phaseolus angularis TaxID=3914 RepID=UPI0022B35BC8|nr:G-type lectin S-receptor-like serine/threonine-protein kinase LECRK3 [Vigna angularis]
MASLTLLIPTLICLQFHFLSFAFAEVDVGSTISTDNNGVWRSPSGHFAFGFRPLNNNTDPNTKLFMVAIWYDMIPDKTVVWSLKTDNKLATAPAGSQFGITSAGLTLTGPKGDSMWTLNLSSVVSVGSMLDTGNFILLTESSEKVWQSFEHPTDTLLPTQSLQPEGTLISRLTDTNYTTGRFQLYFKDGNVLLSPLAWPSLLPYDPYYMLDASGAASTLLFNESGNIYVNTTNGTIIQPQGSQWNISDLDPEVNYYRATLDFTGVFTQYYHPRNNTAQSGWRIMRYVPDNVCNAIGYQYGSGSCGYNSYCSMENQRPTCKCPYGYSLLDPGNQFGGCQPNFTLACGADVQTPPEELYEMHASQDFNFPQGDYERIQPYSRQECQQFCLQDCTCAMAILGGDTCWLKRFPLGNGRQVAVTDNHVVYIKTRVIRDFYTGANGEPSPPPDLKIEHKAKLFLLGPLIGSLVLNSILFATVALFILKKQKANKISKAARSPLETNLHSFTYENLKKATENFQEEIGRGSYGIVYKGQLEAGSCHVIAVKRLDRLVDEREKEFRTELSSIGRTCHKNLVRLIGFCDEGINRILVYEFMSNGSLADILFGKSKPRWNVRVGFALGIARGLVYLHEECEAPIIHCDIKPQNILIDEYFNPKISDFGLAKLLLSEQSRTTTMIRGTRGYVAPEWFKNVAVTVKVDVYSFGVMLLEIICSRRSVLMMEPGEEEKAVLSDWACDCFVEGRIDVLVENDEEALSDYVRLQKWVKIAIWCIHEEPQMRPTMGIVMQMLEGVVEVPNPPSLMRS